MEYDPINNKITLSTTEREAIIDDMPPRLIYDACEVTYLAAKVGISTRVYSDLYDRLMAEDSPVRDVQIRLNALKRGQEIMSTLMQQLLELVPEGLADETEEFLKTQQGS